MCWKIVAIDVGFERQTMGRYLISDHFWDFPIDYHWTNGVISLWDTLSLSTWDRNRYNGVMMAPSPSPRGSVEAIRETG